MEQNFEHLESLQPIERIMFLANQDIEKKILRAMVCSLSDTDKETLRNQETPYAITRILDSLDWEEQQIGHDYDIKPQPKYRPADEVLKEFLNPKSGKKQAARKELQVRLPYLAEIEQKKTIYAFLDTEVKTDRVFMLKYLDEHFDPMYLKAVETVWELHHDFEAAKLLTHYAPIEFVIENQDQLANDYRYFPVRLCLPAETPIDRSRLEMHELIHLCARQNLPLTEREAFSILSKTTTIELGQQVRFYDDDSLFGLPRISSIIWALGRLGYQDIITKFYVLNEKTKPLFNSQDDTRNILTSIFEEMDKCGFLILKND